VTATPVDRKYTKTHEWFLAEGNEVTVGITQFAADELTDITYVDLPAMGTRVSAGGTICEIESVKATSDLYCAVDGEIVAVNDSLADAPELVNSEPYNGGWMVKIRADDLSSLDALLDGAAYDEMLSNG
jgi:glycine cleavage system H protein